MHLHEMMSMQKVFNAAIENFFELFKAAILVEIRSHAEKKSDDVQSRDWMQWHILKGDINETFLSGDLND